jgi:Ca-activated chloride channel family protein
LWATRRVGHLLEEIRLHGENAELRDEVTTLAREYGIVTPYTAYLILEDETRRDVPTTMRSFQSFEKDKVARQEALQNWNDFKTETGGEKAVAASRYGLALKLADSSAAAVQGATVESVRTLGLSSANAPESQPPAGRVRVAEYSRQTRFAGGKSFFQNNDQWIDSAVQANREAKVTRIQFGSAEYFDLATKNPKALPWLALGSKVQFVLDDTIYNIYE